MHTRLTATRRAGKLIGIFLKTYREAVAERSLAGRSHAGRAIGPPHINSCVARRGLREEQPRAPDLFAEPTGGETEWKRSP